MSHFFNDAQYAALVALCNTLVPDLPPPANATPPLADYYRRTASDLDVPRRFTETVRDYATPEAQAQLRLLLTLLSSPLGTGLLTGNFKRFTDLPFATRELVLQRWAVSPIGLLRQSFQGLKRLAHGLFFSILDDYLHNPNWDAIGYAAPPPTIDNPPPKAIRPLAIDQHTTLECDVVIVGSGAGGGVAAGVLAKAGLKVIVLEKGRYYAEADFTRREFDAFQKMYEQAGNLTTEDLGIVVLAGATLGGGTTVNWAASFRTPDSVLHEWETKYHVAGLTSPQFQYTLDAVCQRAHVDTDESHLNPQNLALQNGCAKLGYHHALIPRNVRQCVECGWCGLGCVFGAKQSTLKTWLQDAHEAHADIIVNCHADQVLIENGRAVGVAATLRPIGGDPISLTVRARAVVVAAGALHTPALLLRSRVPNPNIGLNLRLHPTTAVRSEFDQPVQLWRGVMMGAYSAELINLDGEGYGAMLETPPAHPGLLAFSLPWQSAQDYKGLMSRIGYQAALVVLTRDKAGGRVTIDKTGRPRLHYTLAPHDAKHLLAGVEAGLRVMVAAGAKEVASLHAGLPPYRVDDSAHSFETYISNMHKAGAATNSLGLFSAHQMGTCRMGGERATSVVDHNGEAWDVRNLYIADASLFPTSSGVNPMITIQALAYHVASRIAEKIV